MITIRTLATVALGLALATHALQAQGRPQYRDFQLGADLLTVSALTKVTASDVKTVHLRPAVIQQLAWRLPYSVTGSMAPETDPVKQIDFSFYNDQLFRLVINYDRQRTGGMTSSSISSREILYR